MGREFKTIVNIPGWVENFGASGKLTSETAAYERVPLVYRCTRLIADSLSSVELKVYKGKGKEKQEVEWPFEFDTVEWTWNTISSILLLGASYSIPLKGVFGRAMGFEWLDPTTITVDVEPNSKNLVFSQTNAVGGQRSQWTANEMVYIKELKFGDSLRPGASAAKVAMGDANLENYLTKFASYYFENGAMPLTIIPLPTNTQDDEVKRVEKMWKSMATGIRRAWTIMGLRVGKDGGQPYTLTAPLKDLMMPQLDAKARKSVADAFSIPITMLDDAANYATAAEHNSQFWKTCIRPRGVMICSRLNKFLKKNFDGMYAEYAFEELDEFQEDEANRADSVVKLTTAGVPLVVALDVLGYDLTADQRLAIGKEVERRMQVQERIASAEAGGSAGSPSGGQGNAPAQSDPTPDPSPLENTPMERGNAALRSALFNWKAAALKAVKTGHDLKDLDFDHPAIPEDAARNIRAALRTCKSADEVQGVFRKAREWASTSSASVPPDALRNPEESTQGRGGQSSSLMAELKRANDLLEMSLQEETC